MRVTCVLTLFIIGLAVSPAQGLEVVGSSESTEGGPVVFLSDLSLSSKSPASRADQIISYLIQRDLSFAERFDLGTALFMQGRPRQAEMAYLLAVGKAESPEMRAMAYLAAAQSAHAIDRDDGPWDDRRRRSAFARAGEYANLAQRGLPNNEEIAKFRYAFWKNSGDALEASVALSHARRLGMNLDGYEVLDPGTLIVVSIAASTLIYAIVHASKEGVLSSEEAGKAILIVIAMAGAAVGH